MTYNKPEVSVIGDASTVIESLSFKSAGPAEGTGPQPDAPAYDLDE